MTIKDPTLPAVPRAQQVASYHTARPANPADLAYFAASALLDARDRLEGVPSHWRLLTEARRICRWLTPAEAEAAFVGLLEQGLLEIEV